MRTFDDFWTEETILGEEVAAQLARLSRNPTLSLTTTHEVIKTVARLAWLDGAVYREQTRPGTPHTNELTATHWLDYPPTRRQLRAIGRVVSGLRARTNALILDRLEVDRLAVAEKAETDRRMNALTNRLADHTQRLDELTELIAAIHSICQKRIRG